MFIDKFVAFLTAQYYHLINPDIRAKLIYQPFHCLNVTNLKIGKGTVLLPNVVLLNYKNLSIGESCLIGPYCCIKSSHSPIKIGSNVSLNPFCFVDGNGDVSIEQNTRIGPYVFIGPAKYNYKENGDNLFLDMEIKLNPLSIGQNCWIGNRVTIHPGSKLPSNCIVGQSTSIYKDYENHEYHLLYNYYVRNVNADVLL